MSGLGLLEVVARTVIIYFVVLLMVRLMGKREIGQLSPFDFVVAIIIAEVAALPMEQPEIPLLRGLVPLFVLVALEIAFSYAILHSRWLRQLMCGRPQVVISNGRILNREMRRARYNLDDLLSQLREKGYPNPAEVAFAVLETSGRLSVVPWAEVQPPTRQDLGLKARPTGLPKVLVADGELLLPDLRAGGRERDWLEAALQARGLRPKDAFLVTLSPDGELFVSPREGFPLPTAKKED
ncbi:DUF421 domain-containing protein [Thermodesulfitimonas autotrophica]|uniref:DUF421 domain-containing protein n=1 Tax=Thermodesulfitimonas autotrophica TaxID=1894989 RepID=UPI001B870BE8|nr:DUF421 domain-containing protein [Thermodesulfitimonas autotrophica]